MQYRVEIDGLRTIAVCAVLIYHMRLTFGDYVALKGGYLGVDIFFVISGFLISRIIVNEWAETGKFSLVDFYERRARRLLPVLLVVIGVSAIAAWGLLIPSQMKDFAWSAISSMMFVSNIFWFLDGQKYGALSGLYQPLLHTWSLAVEEQFYIFFPFVLLGLLRIFNKHVAWALTVFIGLAFVAALFISAQSFTFSFFMIFSRIWELAAGALIAVLLHNRLPSAEPSSTTRYLPTVGLILITVSLLTVGLKTSLGHPGFGTLAVIIGTCLIILFANDRDPATRLLSTGPFVGIGLISYSLYLWHYPVYAFGRLYSFELTTTDYLVWLTLTFGLSILSYRLVEGPFRSRKIIPLRPFLALTLSGAFVLLAFCVFIITSQGYPDRLTRLNDLYAGEQYDNNLLRAESWSLLGAKAKKEGFGRSYAGRPSRYEREKLSFSDTQGVEKILIVGNSHAKDMFNALYQNSDRLGGREFARFGMAAQFPQAHVDDLLESPNFQAADKVVLSFRYLPESFSDLRRFLETLAETDKAVSLMLNTVEFKTYGPYAIFDEYVRLNNEVNIDAINALAWSRQLENFASMNDQLRRLAAEFDLVVYDKSDFLCDPKAERCWAVTPDGNKVHYDGAHFTLKGAKFLGEIIAETGWIEAAENASGESED